MADFKLISADSHVVEPDAAWARVQKEYGDRAPHVVKDPSGVPKGSWLITDGLVPIGVSHFFDGLVFAKPDGISNIETGNFAKAADFNAAFRWEDFPEGWDPVARLQAQDRDGVEAEILYASPARFFYGLTDAPFQHAILRSYNGWLEEFCSYNRKRLVGVPLLTILEMNQTVKDIHELARRGFKVAQIPSAIKDSGYYEPFYEPLWRAAAEAGLVLSIHTTSTQGQPRTHFEGPRDVDPRTVPLGHARLEETAQRFMGHLIFSGVFDRYPSLKVVLAEFDVGWVSHVYQQANYAFDRASSYDREKNVQKLAPTEYLDRNIFFTFQDDRAGVLTTEVYGRNNYLWASDFPHGVTTWPYSQQTVERNFKGIEGSLAKRIARQNAIDLYRLDLAA